MGPKRQSRTSSIRSGQLPVTVTAGKLTRKLKFSINWLCQCAPVAEQASDVTIKTDDCGSTVLFFVFSFKLSAVNHKAAQTQTPKIPPFYLAGEFVLKWKPLLRNGHREPAEEKTPTVSPTEQQYSLS